MTTKDQILLYLKEKKGDWISGESLSNRMSISRSAIWKHIRKLKEEGYLIESYPKKGYLLRKTSHMLLPNEIREGLDTKLFGKKDIFHSTKTGSTNTAAKDLASRGAPEGTLVISEEQTGGRGRKGRRWFSPLHEGIYISLILRPDISPVEAPKMTLLTAVIVAETLLSLTTLKINIKWPNDILVNGKKIAGVLTEISSEMDAVNYIVVGLGLNVNIPSFPDDISDTATSLLKETGEVFQRAGIIKEYLKWYEKYYEIFKVNGFGPVLDRWKKLSDIMGREIMVEMTGDRVKGVVEDIDKDGILILRDHEGAIHRVFSGDVVLI